MFSFDVRALGVVVSRWTYEFAEAEGGTWISEIWTDRRGTGPRAALLRWIGRTLIRTPDRVSHNREMIQITLRALKAHLETERAG